MSDTSIISPVQSRGIDILKLLAIAAVVLIHAGSSFRLLTTGATPAEQNYLAFDQFLRFSVPLFIALSGFTLAATYRGDLSYFYRRRLLRVLPLYFLWMGIIFLVTHLSPNWSGFINSFPLWQAVFLGRADYQLYFVPLIFQLYLLFPFLYCLTRKFPWITLTATFLFQIIFLRFMTVGHGITVINHGFLSDQEQYLLFASWIFYFVLGVFFAGFLPIVKKHRFLVAIFFMTTIAAWFGSYQNGLSILRNGQNIIDADRFTRLPILLYASSFITLVLLLADKVGGISGKVGNFLVALGRQSYLIYLAHTLVLRLIVSLTLADVAPHILLFAATIVIGGIVVSVKWPTLGLLTGPKVNRSAPSGD